MTTWARHLARVVGHPATLFSSCVLVVGWLFAGLVSEWSEAWRIWCNSAMIAVTFLVVVLLQTSQNRETAELQRKLDEVLRRSQRAQDLDELEDFDGDGTRH